MINDYGVTVRPIGAPGSLERVKVQYPKLISLLKVRFDNDSYCEIFAHDDLIRQNGINSKLERDSIIKAAKEA